MSAIFKWIDSVILCLIYKDGCPSVKNCFYVGKNLPLAILFLQ